MVSRKQNWLTKSLLAVNALMAATFLLCWNGSIVSTLLFVVNNVLVIGFTVAMIGYLFAASASMVPELVFPVAAVVSNIINIMSSFIPMALLVLVMHHPFYKTWLYFFLAAANVYYRDISHICKWYF